MPELSKKLLGKACAGVRIMIPGIIDLATLSLAYAPLPTAGAVPTPKRALLAEGRHCTRAEPRVASQAVAGPLAPPVEPVACTYPDSLATRDMHRMYCAIDYAIFKKYQHQQQPHRHHHQRHRQQQQQCLPFAHQKQV